MNKILEINEYIGSIVWGWPMIILLFGTGVILFFATKGLVLRRMGYILKNTFFKMFEKTNLEDGELSPFQAVATSLAATVGIGNIVGVSLAISVGGPGAVFWIWVSAFFGLSTKFAEVVLAIAYREKNPKNGTWSGGPMYYLKNGLKAKWLGSIFALFAALASLGIGNMTQSNAVAEALETNFGLDRYITGIILIILAGTVIIGGIKRIGQITEKLVPFMALFYTLSCVVIIALSIDKLPGVISSIFSGAFTNQAAFGGFAGATVMMAMKNGIARGLFSNEAGLGSGPIAHATASTDHPVRQGLWGVFEVIVDTFLICSLTAFVILLSDRWHEGLEGAALTTQSFATGLKGGGFVVAVGIALFAFSTILGWYYYGEKNFEFIVGEKYAGLYKLAYIPLVFVGAIGGLKPIWAISDTLNGLMAIPNLIGIILLLPVVIRLSKDFFKDPDRIRESDEEYKNLLK